MSNDMNGNSSFGEKTVANPGFTMPAAPKTSDLNVTVFDGTNAPYTLSLNSFGSDIIPFGRENPEVNRISFKSRLVSKEHGRFRRVNGVWQIEDRCMFDPQQRPSTNGTLCNGSYIQWRALCDGDLVRIDNRESAREDGVLMVFSAPGTSSAWTPLQLQNASMITIGRDPSSQIVLNHVSVSRRHAYMTRDNYGWTIVDNNSTNGVMVNGQRINHHWRLQERDVISLATSRIIFTSAAVYYHCNHSGISVDVNDVVITRKGKGGKSFVTGNHINLNIRPGELVSIIGGSGAGKSTILNAMCGYLKPASGEVYINGVDLYRNFESLKKIIGYVPQQDIVFDNLTLYDMLTYTAKLRLPADTTPEEREAAITRAIHLVELDEKRDALIKALSGGQRKRASIAVELLPDPNLLFLDEPASGLDPGTERSLMTSLRKMADSGKTIILVTHSTLQLEMCDKVVFMGKGGNLCYFGAMHNALQYFGVKNVVDVYAMITDHAPQWKQRYDSISASTRGAEPQSAPLPARKGKGKAQLPILISRTLKLVLNDRQRLLLLLIQAPLLAVLISLVADGKQYDVYDSTKSLLFALSCSAFWVGMLNAIQEICKERTITKREYMTGLSLTSYVLSKIAVLGLLCLVQSVLIVTVFGLTVGLPEEGLMLPAYVELLITTFLTAAASAGMGLFVSSLFTNADRAMTVAPILLMPQILFSGLIFKLSGATEYISWLAVCRWSMEGYGTTANLNALDTSIMRQFADNPMLKDAFQHEAEDFFTFTTEHMLTDWGILLAFVIVFLVLARLVLSNLSKDNG